MKLRFVYILLIFALLAGCSQASVTPTAVPSLAPTATLPDAQVQTTSVPETSAAARAYLDAWVAEDYPAMYAMLSQVSQDAISQEEFSEHYQGIAQETALKSLNYEILSSLTNPDTAQVGYRVFFESALAGDFRSDTLMNLSLENGQGSVHACGISRPGHEHRRPTLSS